MTKLTQAQGDWVQSCHPACNAHYRSTVLLVLNDTQPSTPRPRGNGYKAVMQHAMLITGALSYYIVSYDTQPSTPRHRRTGYKAVMQHAMLVIELYRLHLDLSITWQ